MSLILDALKKSERQRKVETGSSVDELNAPDDKGRPRRWRAWAALAVFALIAFGAAGAIKLQILNLESVVALFVPVRPSEPATENDSNAASPAPIIGQTTQPPTETKNSEAQKQSESPTPIPAPESAPPELPTQADAEQEPKAPAEETVETSTSPIRLEPSGITDASTGSVSTGAESETATTTAQLEADGEPEVAAKPANPEPEPAPLPKPMPKPVAAAAVLPSLPKPPLKPGTIPQSKMPSGFTAEQHNKRAQEFEQSGSFGMAIEEYSRAIQLRPQFTEAYYGRGWAYETTGAHEQAIMDFNRVIQHLPDFAGAYYGRGWVYERTGRIDQAIKEYGKTVRLEPDNTDAYLSRGILQFYSNRPLMAERDFDIVYERGSGSIGDYALLWTYLSRMRSGNSELDTRAMIVGRKIKSKWPGVILSVYLGTADLAQVIAATKSTNQLSQRQRECVAYFFLGELQLIKDDRKGAAEYFRKAVATGVATYRQYWAAEIELQRLGATEP